MSEIEVLAEALRLGETTAEALTRRALARIADRNDELGAFAVVDRERAVSAARQADDELADGHDRGPLHGIPMAVKDLIDVAGLPATRGSAHFAGHRADDDAACVRRLRDAGAVIIGTTVTHEFGYGPTGDRGLHGPARNPHELRRMAGGSSGGSAAAVAAGMVPAALGTDTGGSARIPAAMCGIAGYKPAFGRVGSDGVFPLAPSLDHVGVLGVTARDCRLVVDALAPQHSPPHSPVGAVARIGWLETQSLAPVTPAVADLTRGALAQHDVTQVLVDTPGTMWEAFSAIQNSEAFATHADRVRERPELFDPEVLDRLRSASETPGWRYIQALHAREAARVYMSGLLEHFDLLASPTVGITAPLLGQREISFDGSSHPVRSTLLALTSPWNLLGFPALTVPAGYVGRLPVGVQLICPPDREELLFAVADSIVPSIADS
ncbi:amidase [Streptomyces sp. ME01-18a]|uniref:amidase n=1 Tax=Streptomyces sp. ME01-18a TaxID=3028669 RepID=UPI0029A55075|nr:amidase [Streptomyces sp. ME01-18a]MDX3434313.1 amidase [Streptomyces sp. ME01-18a]